MQTTVLLGSLGGRCHVCTGAGETPDIHKGVSSVFDRAKKIATIGSWRKEIGHDD
jgi:hypothetical protein